MLFNSAQDCAIREVQENQECLELNCLIQVLVYADYVNLFEDNINTIKSNRNIPAHQ
jgi:hypothetical protein